MLIGFLLRWLKPRQLLKPPLPSQTGSRGPKIQKTAVKQSQVVPQTELALGVLAWLYRIGPSVLAFGSVLVVSRCVPWCPALWLPSGLAFGSVLVVSRCVPLCPALWLPSRLAFGSVFVVSRCVPWLLLKVFRRCARFFFANFS